VFKEKSFRPASGILALVVLVAGLAAAVWIFIRAVRTDDPRYIVPALLLFAAVGLGLAGIFAVYPNESKVVTLFGRYVGTVTEPGLWWANPFTVKKKISVRVRNFETSKLKVNDNHGNPIEIGAVVVWQVVDTAEALFEVDDYENFVKIQSEAALRGLATQYPYDSHGESVSLSGNTTEVSNELQSRGQERLAKAGVNVIEARISHLAYSPEIAQAMLQRQQASAIIAARQKIVEGAVGMVEMALELLAAKAVVSLDEERKAAMVSNLLVVLCSDRATQPVVNTGSLYT
jgi:regulator of protease activity HflC (stomatin/prohibitin superfamily)